MSDKDKIKNMSPEEVEQKTVQLLNGNEKAMYFYAGVVATLNSLSIRPEEFANESGIHA